MGDDEEEEEFVPTLPAGDASSQWDRAVQEQIGLLRTAGLDGATQVEQLEPQLGSQLPGSGPFRATRSTARADPYLEAGTSPQ